MQLNRKLGALAVVIAALGACATTGGVPPGTPIDQVRQSRPRPQAEHALPGGGTRLEFNQGTRGKETWMLDFDANGLLVSSTQVLTEFNLRTIMPGMPMAELRRQFGEPADICSVARPTRQQVWNYRFVDSDCSWFQVSIADANQQVVSASMGRDPACDVPSDRMSL